MKTLRALLLILACAIALTSLASAQSITTTSLPNAILNQPYSATLTCANCKGFTWSVPDTAHPLPTGLVLNSISGAITGTPTQFGTVQFQVQLSGPGTVAVFQTLQIVVNASNLSVVTTTVANGTFGIVYPSQTLIATGGVPPYFWFASGTFPPGLNLDSSSGVISGTPTAEGAYTFTVTVSDSQQHTASTKLTIVIADPEGVAILTTSLPNGSLNSPYMGQIVCANCANFLWSLASGTLPPGLALNPTNGTITGTPTVLGTSNFTVALTSNTSSTEPITITQTLAITITNALISINETTIPVAFQGIAYNAPLTGSGGTPPYSWALLSTVNDGVIIDPASGILSGIPVATGQFALSVQITDSLGAQSSKAFVLNVATALSILNTSFPNGSVGIAYPLQTLSAGGGQPPYRWSVTGGTLPAGLTLDSVFGRISGTPTANGTSTFTLIVTDNQGGSARKTLSITIGVPVTITITPTTLPGGTVNAAYSQTLSAAGGAAPYKWSTASGTLPAGVTLNANTGVIAGTPTSAGTSTFTVQATDANQASGQASLSIAVAAVAPLKITTTSLPNATINAAYSQTLAATGGLTPYTWSIVTGTLPAGLSLAPSTGVISGTSTAAASASFTVQVADSLKTTTQQTLSIAVVAPLTVTPTSLPNAIVGIAYSQKLTAAGGVAPYTFAVTLGSLPAGFKLTVDTITGTATSAESSNFTVTATDSAGAKLNVPLTLNAVNPPAPTVTINGIPASSGFSQQLPVTISIGAPYPTDISGSISLTFAPSVSPSAGVDDAMIQFSAGSRVINFTIPAGSTTPTLTSASSITILTGTTAGTITVTTDLTSGGVDLGRTTKTIVNNSGVPFISKVSFQQTTGGVTVTVVGFSSTRDMVSGLFHFAPASNQSFTQSDITVQLASAFTTWYSNTAQSNPYGTQFTLTVPFSLSTQSTSVVSVTVTLTNSKGASNPVSPQ